MTIKAIIFDMDGVVVDSIKHDFAVWKRIFSEFKVPFSFDTYKSFAGMKGMEIVKRFLNSGLSDAEARVWQNRKEHYFLEGLREAKLKTTHGLKGLLENIAKAGNKIGLATAGTRTKTLAVLKELSLVKYFSAIVTADDVGKGKPHPETFLKAAARLRCRPEECIVIEDAPNGIRAAKAAGMRCVAITTTHKNTELAEADKIIDSFDKLTIEDLQNF